MKTGTVRVPITFLVSCGFEKPASAEVETRTCDLACDARQDDDGRVFAKMPDGGWRQLAEGQYRWA